MVVFDASGMLVGWCFCPKARARPPAGFRAGADWWGRTLTATRPVDPAVWRRPGWIRRYHLILSKPATGGRVEGRTPPAAHPRSLILSKGTRRVSASKEAR